MSTYNVSTYILSVLGHKQISKMHMQDCMKTCTYQSCSPGLTTTTLVHSEVPSMPQLFGCKNGEALEPPRMKTNELVALAKL